MNIWQVCTIICPVLLVAQLLEIFVIL